MTAFSLHRGRSLSAAQVVSAAAVTVAAVLLGTFCARLAISHYGSTAIAVLIGTPLAIAVARRPAVGVIALLAVVASAFAYGVLPRVPLPGHPPINIADVTLAAAVGGTIWRRPWRTWPPVVRRYA